MNARNPALIIRGPAIITYKGKVIYSKESIKLTPRITTFGIDTSAYGVADTREATSSLEASFTPVGKIADALAILWPHRSYVPGQLVHRTKTLGAIDTDTETITCTAHGFSDGDGVRLATYGALPAGLAEATKYFVHAASGDSLTLHTTRADALTGANPVNITSAGTGTHRIIEQEEVVIQSMLDGQTVTLHNGCITKMPQVIGAATKTALGEVTFTFYRKHASAAEADNSLFTIAAGTFSDTSFDPADIITEPYDLKWGAAAPWSSIGTKEGCTFEPAMSLSEVIDDAGGIVSHQIDSIEATLTARPNNITESDLLAKLTLQGTGSGRGRRLTSGDNLEMTGTEIYVRLTAASIDDSSINYDGKEDRIGDVKWKANRSASGGVTSALFLIAAENPDA